MNDTTEQRWNLLTGTRRTRSLFHALKREEKQATRRTTTAQHKNDIDCWNYPWSCVGMKRTVPAS
ncbi:MAG: hypothetical protein HQM03_01875 [Magnetococcales bacterium]|nr:hypothetical protein [Magnetococcales bacterium]